MPTFKPGDLVRDLTHKDWVNGKYAPRVGVVSYPAYDAWGSLRVNGGSWTPEPEYELIASAGYDADALVVTEAQR